MDQEVMLENAMSREGVWTIHIVRMGAPVDLDGWLERVPSFAWGALDVRRWVEDGLGMHHLHMSGQIQDVIELKWPGQDGKKQKAAFWWAKEIGIREAIKAAAERLYIVTSITAVKAVVKQAVQQPVVTVPVLGVDQEIRIESAYWAPRGYVVVMAADWRVAE
jgi:hypothetical protein